jgi:hypothetical protein
VQLPDSEGDVRSTVTFVFEDEKPVQMTMQGHCWQKVPTRVEFGAILAGAEPERTFVVRASSGNKVTVTRVDANPELFRISWRPNSTDPRDTDVTVKIRGDRAQLDIDEGVVVWTDDVPKGQFMVRVIARTRRLLETERRTITFGEVALGESKEILVKLVKFYPGNCWLRSVRVSPSNSAHADLSRMRTDDSTISLPLVLDDVQFRGVLRMEVTAEVTNGSREETLTFAAYARHP